MAKVKVWIEDADADNTIVKKCRNTQEALEDAKSMIESGVFHYLIINCKRNDVIMTYCEVVGYNDGVIEVVW